MYVLLLSRPKYWRLCGPRSLKCAYKTFVPFPLHFIDVVFNTQVDFVTSLPDIRCDTSYI